MTDVNYHFGGRRAAGAMLSALIILMSALWIPTALADGVGPSSDPLARALEEIEQVDGKGRWFSYSIALAGCAAGLGLGGWALATNPLSNSDRPDPIILASAMMVTGAAAAQILHGAMRFDERGISATTARSLLNHSDQRKAAGLLFLNHRAAEARSTRFWGGVMTTAQGVGTGVLGLKLWIDGSDGLRTAGIVFSVFGALNTAIGAIHFFGRPRAERVRDRVVSHTETARTVSIKPILFRDEENTLIPGLVALSRF